MGVYEETKKKIAKAEEEIRWQESLQRQDPTEPKYARVIEAERGKIERLKSWLKHYEAEKALGIKQPHRWRWRKNPL